METNTKKVDTSSWLREAAVRASRVHFLYMAAYMAAVIVFDSWNLITHEGIVLRWKAATLVIVVTTITWFLARNKDRGSQYYRLLVMSLVTVDIVFASYNVYWQRGMASKAVALFAVPIITAAVLRSRSTVLAAASMSVAAYTFAAVKYFHLNYGEGYKVELYGEILFYSALFFVLAWLLIIMIKPSKT